MKHSLDDDKGTGVKGILGDKKMNRMIKRLFAGCFICALLSFQAAEAGNPFSEFMENIKKSAANNQQTQPPAAGKLQTEPAHPTGTVLKTANMRAGPGTQHAVLAVVPKDSVVNIVQLKDSWYLVQADTNGVSTSGWISSSLISSSASPSAQLSSGSNTVSNGTSTGSTTPPTGTEAQSNIDYAGYSKEFLPVKQMLVDGKLDEVASFYEMKTEAEAESGGAGKNAEAMNMTGLLYSLEQGTLALDQGDYDKAVTEFSSAERLVEEQQNESILAGGAKKTGGWLLGTILGQEEMFAYEGEGWEQVLMLNYKSIAYLLQGKRQAYNVTRRAIDWQNIQKKAFDQKLREEKEEASEELNKQESNKEETAKEDTQNQAVKEGLAAAFAPMEAKATTVPSAYVNPFGFYVAGMVQEFESYNDRSLRDNARISYEKALELNPDSNVLKQAVKDLAKPQAPSGTRLVHIVVADGFVPEKKVLTYTVQASSYVIPLKMPIYEPVKSKVYRIEVRSTSGTRLATLSPVADVEAICLRQQLDVQPLLTMRAMSSFVVTATAEAAAQQSQGIGGILLKGLSNIRKQTSAPDTRSWMSLPATMQAARLHLRKGISKLRIDTYAKNGKKLSSKTVKIDPNTHNFIYARSIDSMLYTQDTEKLWLAEM